MTDSNAAPAAKRPRPAILALLGAAVVALVVYAMWPAARRTAAPSNAPREQRKQAAAKTNAPGTPGSLEVRLDELKQPPPAPDDETSRNPFRFYVKPPPPPPPPPRAPQPGDKNYVAPPPQPPPPPPGPPPIPLKFIGTIEVK